MNIKDIVKDNTVYFSYASEGTLYYAVKVEDKWYQFPIDTKNTEDVGRAVFLAKDKAIYFMRYIRKALANGNFVLTNRVYHEN